MKNWFLSLVTESRTSRQLRQGSGEVVERTRKRPSVTLTSQAQSSYLSEREVCEDVFKKTQEKRRPRKHDSLHGDVVLSIVFRRTGKQDLKERQKTLKVTRYHGARLKSTRQRVVENASNPKKSSTRPLSPCPKHSSLVIGTDRRTDIPTKVWDLFGEITRNWVKKYSSMNECSFSNSLENSSLCFNDF
jgi:hypothetical protein